MKKTVLKLVKTRQNLSKNLDCWMKIPIFSRLEKSEIMLDVYFDIIFFQEQSNGIEGYYIRWRYSL